MRTNDEIISILEDRRKQKKLSISELARQVNMAKSAVSRYFNKTREFPINRVNDFAKVLDLKPEYILGFERNETTPKDIKEIFSDNLKNLMNKNGDNLTTLSDALDISYSTVSDWMHAKKMPRSGSLQKIATHYNVNVSFLTNESNIRFDKILSSLRKEKGWTMEELGQKMGKTKSAVSRWESGENYPKVDDIEKLSQLFNVYVQSLIFGVDESESDLLNIYNKLNKSNKNKVFDYSEELLKEQESNIIDKTEWTNIDIYSVLSARTGLIEIDPTHIERISYNGYVPKNYDMAFRVQGDSMEPVFEDGEIIFVEKDTDVRNGQIVAVILNDEAYIKKMYADSGQLRLVSLNRNYDDIIVSENNDIEIVGRVIL